MKLIIFILLFICSKVFTHDVLISHNGNLLFYNGPSITKGEKYYFISFVSNRGEVIVKKYRDRNLSDLIKTYIVHKFNKKNIDDHAAPAILYDKKSKKIFLAFSYHCSDLYLYTYNKKQDIFSKLKTFYGKYTYPRLINIPITESKNQVFLIARNLESKKNDRLGNLIYFSSIDDFTKKHTIIKSKPNQVIYASKPTAFQGSLYFTYAIYDYKTKNMQGWHILSYSPSKKIINFNKNISSYLPRNYFYNRPTAIAAKKNKILVATSFYNKKIDAYKPSFMSIPNTVLILLIENNNSIKIIHEHQSISPYYNTDIAISQDFNWLYFNNNKVVTNFKHNKECFKKKHMMYPTFFERSILYTSPNKNNYSIRNWNNSIYLCTDVFKP